MNKDDRFSQEVHAVVCQLSDWMKLEAPDIDRLLPALAVVLGRVIAQRAKNKAEIDFMLDMAGHTATSAAEEYWQTLTPKSSH